MKVVNPVDTLNNRTKIINAINHERERQNAKWGKQVHDYSYWYAILGEEFGEVGQAIQKGSVSYKSTDAGNLYQELIQVAAVATAIAEQILEGD